MWKASVLVGKQVVQRTSKLESLWLARYKEFSNSSKPDRKFNSGSSSNDHSSKSPSSRRSMSPTSRFESRSRESQSNAKDSANDSRRVPTSKIEAFAGHDEEINVSFSIERAEDDHVKLDAAHEAAAAAAESAADALDSLELRSAIDRLQLESGGRMPRWLARACVCKLSIGQLLPIQQVSWQPLCDLISSIHAVNPSPPSVSIDSPINHVQAEKARAQPDVFMQSPTGSGKTLAYLLPLLSSCIPQVPPPPLPIERPNFKHKNLNRLLRRASDRVKTYYERNGLKAVIVAPSRELAVQIYAQAQALLTVDPIPSERDSSSVSSTSAVPSSPFPSSSSFSANPAWLQNEIDPQWRSKSVQLLLPGNSMYSKMREIVGSPPSILIATASPLLELLTEKDLMPEEDQLKVDSFWDRQSNLLEYLHSTRIDRAGKSKKFAKHHEANDMASSGDAADIEIDDENDHDETTPSSGQASASKSDSKRRRRPFMSGMMLDKEIEHRQASALLDLRPKEEHLPQPKPSTENGFRRLASWPKHMPLPSNFRGQRAPAHEHVQAIRRERRLHRNAWTRLEALAITTNSKLLKSLRVVVMDEPDMLLHPPHPYTPLFELEKRRRHPYSAEILLQRIFAIQHARDPSPAVLPTSTLSSTLPSSFASPTQRLLAAAITGPRLVCVSATVSAIMRYYVHRARNLLLLPLSQLPPSQRVQLVLPDSKSKSPQPSSPFHATSASERQNRELSEDSLMHNAGEKVFSDPQGQSDQKQFETTKLKASLSVAKNLRSTQSKTAPPEAETEEIFDEDEAEEELKEEAAREFDSAENDELLTEKPNDAQQFESIGETSEQVDLLDDTDWLKQKSWFREDAQHSEEMMKSRDIGDPFANQRYQVPQQIQHKFFVCEELEKIRKFAQFVRSYRSAASIWKAALSKVESSSASGNQLAFAPISAILAILPDSAPVDRVTRALKSVGLRVAPLHHGLLTTATVNIPALASDQEASNDVIDSNHSESGAAEPSTNVVSRRKAEESEFGRGDDMSRPAHLRRRKQFLSDIQSGSYDVVLTTENTARGLDIPGLQCVALLFSPKLPKDYVHLAGRVGRLGQPGLCVSFASPKEVHMCLPRHAQSLGLELEEWTVNSDEFMKQSRANPAGSLFQAKSSTSAAASLAKQMSWPDFVLSITEAAAVDVRSLASPHLIPTFISLFRQGVLAMADAAKTAPSLPRYPLIHSNSPAIKSSPSLLQDILSISMPSPLGGRILSGSSLRLEQRMKSAQKLQRRHQRLREELSVRMTAAAKNKSKPL